MSTPHFTRRDFLRTMLAGTAAAAASCALLPRAHAFGEADYVRIALLKHNAPNWNPHPHALSSLLNEVSLTTSIQTAQAEETVDLETGDFAPFPLMFVCGSRAFAPWSERARKRLRRYIGAGGMLVFDSSDDDPDGGFKKSVERELQEILPDKKLSQTSQSHVLYKSFYLCNGSEGRTALRQHTETIIDEGRIQVLYIYNDLLGAYDQHANAPSYAGAQRHRTRDLAYRLGVNLVMYALTLDYKEDQVHVPFILRRRRWTVP